MRKICAVLLIAVAGVTSGCFKKELTPEEKALAGNLRAELAVTLAELDSAKAKDASLSGGLVKALVAVRVEILGVSAALIQQRLNSIESGAPVTQVTQISPTDPDLAKQLESEISIIKGDLAKSQDDRLAYGGMVGAVRAATAATQEQTLAMLQQRYLMAKYGLNAPAPRARQENQAVATAKPLSATKSAPDIPPGTGPFGLEAGLSKDLIEKMSGQQLTMGDETQSLYILHSPPKPNDAFEEYALVISPSVGLCQIRAIGKTIVTNNYGHQLREAFTKLQDSLAAVYGKPKVFDWLLPGSIWNEPRDWTNALHKKDRTLVAEWHASSAAPLKSGVQRINMAAFAESGDKGYLAVQYSFDNYEACKAEEGKRSTSSL
ncbi:Uncharacterised protein [Pseudomonas putida]|nr:Uncharacterised protein [Pseudomonas putida]